MHRIVSLATLIAGAFLIGPAQASVFSINDSGCCLEMNPVVLSAPVTIGFFDPGPPSWILGPSPSFVAVEFNFTVAGCISNCASPANEAIRFDGDLTTLGSGEPSQSITGSACGFTITGNGTYDTICMVNPTDVSNISAAFNVDSADVLSIGFQGPGPGTAPDAGFCGINCTATITFYQTTGDLPTPEPGTLAMAVVGLGLCFGFRRLLNR